MRSRAGCRGPGLSGAPRRLPRAPGQTCAPRRRISVAPRAEPGGGRERWDIGRFLRTVLFFNPLPTPQSLLASLTGSKPGAAGAPAGPDAGEGDGWVLVTGATGGVGRRVARQLLAQGCRVRALVRDPAKAASLLGQSGPQGAGQLQIVAGDITRPESLLPAAFQGLRAVVSATAATVAPKEGDTPDRQKYRQGVRFYEPEVVGQSPEAVECGGVRNLLAAVRQAGGLGGELIIFDASTESPAAEWGPLDDVVMGGASESGLRRDSGGAAVFSGRVSEANSGGFASVRSRNFSPPLRAAGCHALRLRLRGDGQRYKLTVRTDEGWDGIGYTSSFDTREGAWQDVELPFAALRPIFRAKTKADAPPFDPASIVSVQLMLSKFEYDGGLNPRFRPGAFELPVSRIAAVRTASGAAGGPPRLVHVSSAGVTRPGRPGLDLDKEPPAVRLDAQLGGLLRWKLAGEDAVRGSGLPFAVVRPVALTEEPAGAPLQAGQGDTLKGKVSREDVAELCVALLGLPQASGLTFELKSTVPFSEEFRPDAGQPRAARDWAALLAGLRPGITGKQGEEAATSV